jgi:DUF2934 family protein
MNSPTHHDISQRAHQLWLEQGSPAGRDTEIWLEAERQIASAGAPDSGSAPEHQEASRTTTESKGASGLAARVKSETASERRVENHAAPVMPEKEAVKAAVQKKSARAPKVAVKMGVKAKPPETGKPLWDRPHSS